MNVVIVDDEPLARSRLKRLLGDSFDILGEAANGVDALALIENVKPDLVFLDIDMPGISGLEIANELNELTLPPAIIFVTAHPEHALDAIDLSAAGYLVKPVSLSSLEKTLKKLGRLNKVHLHKQQSVTIPYQLAGSLRSVEMNDVFYFSAEEKYTKMVFANGEVFIEQSLKQLEQQYSEYVLRIHRNRLINKKKLVALHTHKSGHHLVELKGLDKQLLSVSRRSVKLVKCVLQSTE